MYDLCPIMLIDPCASSADGVLGNLKVENEVGLFLCREPPLWKINRGPRGSVFELFFVLSEGFFLSSFEMDSRRNMKPSWVQVGTKLGQLGGFLGIDFRAKFRQVGSKLGSNGSKM